VLEASLRVLRLWGGLRLSRMPDAGWGGGDFNLSLACIK